MTAEANHIDEMLGTEQLHTEYTGEEFSHEPEVQEDHQHEVEQEEQEHKPTPEESYKAMAHEERQLRRDLQSKVDMMNRRFEQMIASMQPPPQQPEPEPDYDEDPVGATHNKVDRALKAVEELKRNSEVQRQSDEWNGYVRGVQADEAQFKAKTPDYNDAVAFLQNRRATELQAMGYGDEDIMRVIASDAYAVTQRAQQLGKSPAAFAYEMARSVGYKPKQAGQSLEQMAAGQRVARSVGGGGVSAGDSTPSLEDLANMSDADFEKLFNRMQPRH